MAEDPEEIHPQQWVCSGGRIEKVSVKEAIKHQLDQGSSEDGKGEDQQEGSDERHPDEQRHAQKAHPWGPHVDDRDHEVERRGQGGEPQHLQPEQPEVDAVPRREGGLGQVGIGKPTDVGSAAQEEAGVHEQAASQENPEAEGIQAREGDIARADHERHDVIEEGSIQRHDDQEDHDRTMHGEELVVEIRADDVLVGLSELDAHEHRLNAADEEKDEC